MIRRPTTKGWQVGLGLLSIVVLMLAYTAMSYWQHNDVKIGGEGSRIHINHEGNPDDTTIPTWTQLGGGIKQAFTVHTKRSGEKERWVTADGWASLKRLAVGLFFGVSGALAIGLLMGCFAKVEAFCLPTLAVIAAVPGTAALAVYFVLVGTDMSMYVTMIAIGVGAPMARAIGNAAKDVPMELIYKAKTLGASDPEVMFNVILRCIWPKIITNIRIGIPTAIVFLIAAEMVVGHMGFGYRIRLQQKLLNMSVVYPYLAVLAAFGYMVDIGLRVLQRVACPWYSSEGG